MRSTLATLLVAAVMCPYVARAEGGPPPVDPGRLEALLQQAASLERFAAEVAEIEREIPLGLERGYSRADLLVRRGRTAAASGKFAESAAAYAMFLGEFGVQHEYSERILPRLIESLAPLDLNHVDVFLSNNGPEYRPQWRMGQTAPESHLRQAISVCDLTAVVATDARGRACALHQLGWIYRAIGDWEASTHAWDRCAEECEGAPLAEAAAWLSIENLEWTGNPSAAARRLRQFVEEHPGDRRVGNVGDRAEILEAAARRSDKWHRDPVASLLTEIDQRRARRSSMQVFRDVMTWVKQRGDTAAQVAIARWAAQQADWPARDLLLANAELVNALLGSGDADQDAQLEAADALERQVALAPDDSEWLIGAAIRRSSLLRGLGRSEEAVTMWSSVVPRLTKSPGRVIQAAPEQIRVLIDVGDKDAAVRATYELERQEPDHPELGVLRSLVFQSAEEGNR